MIISVRLLQSFIPYLALAFAASAIFRVARMRFPGRAAGLWALPKGPSIALAAIEGSAALFLLIATTLVWGLFLVAILTAAHAAALWKTWPSDPVQT